MTPQDSSDQSDRAKRNPFATRSRLLDGQARQPVPGLDRQAVRKQVIPEITRARKRGQS